MHYTQQKEAIETFRKTVYNLRVGAYKSLMPWQHGVITTSNAIIEIFELLRNHHGVKYILTSRFNQVGIYPQRSRTDLNKRSLPRPKTTTA